MERFGAGRIFKFETSSILNPESRNPITWILRPWGLTKTDLDHSPLIAPRQENWWNQKERIISPARKSKFLWNSTCARRRLTRSWKRTGHFLAASPGMKWHISAERQQNRSRWRWSTLALPSSLVTFTTEKTRLRNHTNAVQKTTLARNTTSWWVYQKSPLNSFSKSLSLSLSVSSWSSRGDGSKGRFTHVPKSLEVNPCNLGRWERWKLGVTNVQDRRLHMSFILKGSQMSALQLKGWFKSKTSI